MTRQLSFDLPARPALGRDDFMVAPSNAIAVAMIENWQGWAGGKLALTGPPGAGKTHLAHVWAAAADARIVPARDLAGADIPSLAQTCVAVEDVPAIKGDIAAQTALFHLHNLVLSEGRSLLLTGSGAVPHWPLDLPDLVSRIAAAPTAALDPPDDALLCAVLAKLFADRQLTPKPDVIPYLARRMVRSFAAAGDLVAALDSASLARQRPVTRALAAQVLDNGPTGAR
ncbi:chromosomal replication initiator DnaA [Sulfitobacter sabulilitoris]|uniref:Chromosomal replication initiator DnaA n=1 Tax=Sulfitobacter sabulilitoris TaxID=2562655 RepID=A0A5S3PBC4_9RHOB|nr:chromosomal replication initiator DnaA [Sulfitobacter sabulilitoris]TMM50904.1 chromosomal replication initiator DnaA [Sulfitobacter sabulilitoris]